MLNIKTVCKKNIRLKILKILDLIFYSRLKNNLILLNTLLITLKNLSLDL